VRTPSVGELSSGFPAIGPHTPTPGYTSSEVEEGAAVTATTGLDRTLLPSEMAALVRTARNSTTPERTRSMI